jgi:hypothetical protein
MNEGTRGRHFKGIARKYILCACMRVEYFHRTFLRRNYLNEPGTTGPLLSNITISLFQRTLLILEKLLRVYSDNQPI